MIQHRPRRSRTQLWTKPVAALVIGSMTLPSLAGCGGNAAQQASAPPLDAIAGQAPMRPATSAQRPGMSGKQKMVLLAGAAALYYICLLYTSPSPRD